MSDTSSADAVTKTGYLGKRRRRPGGTEKGPFNPKANISSGIARRADELDDPRLSAPMPPGTAQAPVGIDRGNKSTRERVMKRRYGG